MINIGDKAPEVLGVNENGDEIRVLNKNETMLASQQQDAMKAAFKDWIFKDQQRRVRLVRVYNERIKVSDYKGKKIALYFYPKDNTSGCTAQACSLRDGYSDLRNAGYEVIGVSIDSMASHTKFKTKHDLPFTLIADTDKTLVEQFGVWGEKKMYGKSYMGTFRTTFIIDEKGVVEKIISPKEVKTKEHSNQILNLQ